MSDETIKKLTIFLCIFEFIILSIMSYLNYTHKQEDDINNRLTLDKYNSFVLSIDVKLDSINKELYKTDTLITTKKSYYYEINKSFLDTARVSDDSVSMFISSYIRNKQKEIYMLYNRGK